MDKKIKYWILLSIDQTFAKRGLGLGELFDKRPDFIEDDYNKLSNYLEELRKEKLLEIKGLGKYKLTEKGEKDLDNYLRNIGMMEHFSLVQLVPEFEVKYRLKMIEGFIGSLVIMVFLALIMEYINFVKNNSYIKFVLASVFFLFFILFLISAISITFNFLFRFFKIISKRFFRWAKRYQFPLIIITIVIIFMTGIWIFITITDYKLKDIIAQIIVGIFLLVLIQFIKNKKV